MIRILIQDFIDLFASELVNTESPQLKEYLEACMNDLPISESYYLEQSNVTAAARELANDIYDFLAMNCVKRLLQIVMVMKL